jgi:predicted amidohydrolase YtcJ
MVAASNGQHVLAVPPPGFPVGPAPRQNLVAHNAAFDQAVFERLRDLGVIPPTVQPMVWHDTAALCATYAGAPRAWTRPRMSCSG